MENSLISIDKDLRYNFNEYPRYKVYVKVLEWRTDIEKHYSMSGTLRKFINSSINGDVILIEYPLFFTEGEWLYKRSSIKIDITNVRSDKFIELSCNKLAIFWGNIKSFKILNND